MFRNPENRHKQQAKECSGPRGGSTQTEFVEAQSSKRRPALFLAAELWASTVSQRGARRARDGRTATDTAQLSTDPQTPHHQQQQQGRRSPLGTRPESAAPGTAPGTALSGLRPKVSRRVTAQPHPSEGGKPRPPHWGRLHLQNPHSKRDQTAHTCFTVTFTVKPI